MQLPAAAKLREVGPRDGFQNEPEIISTDDKVRLIDALARTGLRRLELTSFVRPDVIPQLADAREVLRRVELTAAFHNARGQGLANVLAALQAGCRSFGSSFGELGGCPVPQGATGNIATEDLVSMLHEMGIATGVDLARLLAVTADARAVLGR